MKTVPKNPSTNILGKEITEAKIIEAISESGYPLQTVIANLLRNNFFVQEEWCFIDSDKKIDRSIDIYAEKYLFEPTEPQPRVRPILNLLIECKQSKLPYIFFLSESKPHVPQFPVISGLFSKDIVLTSDDDPSSWRFSFLRAFDLINDPFLNEGPEFCMTFSKCVRKGNNIELSGADPFYNLVFPLLKSVSYFHQIEQPPVTAMYFDCHLAFCLGVLDAPMIGIRVVEGRNELVQLPWVRVVRHQSSDDPEDFHRNNIYAIEVIHKDFLQIYLMEHLLPFANRFSSLALKHQNVLANGKGFASGLGMNSWANIEKRLETQKIHLKAKRYSAMGKNIVNFFLDSVVTR